MELKGLLNDIKVIEFSSYVMTPLIGKVLADYGAHVIKIESRHRPDRFRLGSPFVDGNPGNNRSGLFSHLNSSKYSLALNLGNPKAIDILHRLMRGADIMLDGYSPGTVAKWGLSYKDLKKIKPDIIMLSASMQGQVGPLAKQRGLGHLMQASAGFVATSHRADQEPLASLSPYTDYITPWYALVAIISALDVRRRTGEGNYIDITQIETGIQFLSPFILDYTANGRAYSASGNRATYAVPHNTYRCRGDDRWCAIAIFNDEEWKALCSVIGNPAMEKDVRFASILERKRHEDELDKLVEEWTVRHTPDEVKSLLQDAGITADVVANGRDLSEDPYFRSSGFFDKLDHPEMGQCTYFHAPFRLSGAPSKMRRAPLLGEHTEYVATEVLGMSDEEFVGLMNEGVFE